MKIPDIDLGTISSALSGELKAVNQVLKAIQTPIFNLAIRMLGNREDAADACQEILLKVITRLDSFRAEAAFGTWVFQIAKYHLLNAITRNKEAPVLSLESMAEQLKLGLDIGAVVAAAHVGEHTLTPEDKVEARQIALNCTQSMLMSLDRNHRLVYLLDVIFGLTTEQAALVLEITPSAYRKRLSRARKSLDNFTKNNCGLANPGCACTCSKQIPALKLRHRLEPLGEAHRLRAARRDEAEQIERQFDSIVRMSDSAALFRAHPDYHTPSRIVEAIRKTLTLEGWAVSSAGISQ